MLSDAQWAVLEPLVEICRPKGKTPPRAASSLTESAGFPFRPISD